MSKQFVISLFVFRLETWSIMISRYLSPKIDFMYPKLRSAEEIFIITFCKIGIFGIDTQKFGL